MVHDPNDNQNTFPRRADTKKALLDLIRKHGGTIRTTDRNFDVYEKLADHFKLSQTARTQKSTGSGNQTLWRSEVGYSRFELVQEGLLEPKKVSGRGIWKLTATALERNREQDGVVLLDDEADLSDDEAYTPDGVDSRELVYRQIRARRGQQLFRNALLEQYQNVCVVTGCKIIAILEAAHIKPYRGKNDNHPSNGLLLRADIHTLFDLDLLGIEPTSLRVELHPSIAEYKDIVKKLRLNMDSGLLRTARPNGGQGPHWTGYEPLRPKAPDDDQPSKSTG